MARAGHGGLETLSSDDDLIEIVDPRASNTRNNNLEPLILPQPHAFSNQPPPPPSPQDRRRRIPLPPPHPRRQTQPDAVIDLTEEPDSPVEIRPPLPVTRQHRNPRRTNSIRITPPRLSRSESVVLTPGFIDLTGDDDQEPEHPRRSLRNNYQPSLGTQDHDHLIQVELENIRRNSRSFLATDFARGLRRTLAGFLGTGVIQGGDVFAGADFPTPPDTFRQREPSPKPPMDPVPPAKPGFTRDTCAEGETQVVICPACNEELAYEPGETIVTTSSGKKRRKGEHHFWALKKCGHVYCAECFENRRPTKASPHGVGFRPPAGKAPLAAPTEIRCAVDTCETKVANKTEWIGIYL